jgi:hypothetical protein
MMKSRAAGSSPRPGVGAAITLLAATLACTSGAPRVVEDVARGCRYVAPPGWLVLDAELRSRATSLFSTHVYDLVGADRRFVAQLPESLVPQLEEWARTYYIVDGEPVRAEATLGGRPALELTYRIRVRDQAPSSKLTYWVVRHGDRLFVLRAAFAPAGLSADEPAVREMLSTWTFLEPRDAAPPPPPPRTANALATGAAVPAPDPLAPPP